MNGRAARAGRLLLGGLVQYGLAMLGGHPSLVSGDEDEPLDRVVPLGSLPEAERRWWLEAEERLARS